MGPVDRVTRGAGQCGKPQRMDVVGLEEWKA